ncbi:MAG: hypothetical protein PHG59_02520 [Patescibacteria group bacterium]|jgi:hypothetical protein|nr:hypothetical protein [Patescibacteria group bacterium]
MIIWDNLIPYFRFNFLQKEIIIPAIKLNLKKQRYSLKYKENIFKRKMKRI